MTDHSSTVIEVSVVWSVSSCRGRLRPGLGRGIC